MKKTLIAIFLSLSCTSAFAFTYDCHTDVKSEWVADQRDHRISFYIDDMTDVSDFLIDGMPGKLDETYRPHRSNLGYSRLIGFDTESFVSVMLSPDILNTNSEGTMKLGIMIGSYHGEIAYFPYQCKQVAEE